MKDYVFSTGPLDNESRNEIMEVKKIMQEKMGPAINVSNRVLLSILAKRFLIEENKNNDAIHPEA